MIENLLPTAGVFELLHAENKQVLWSSCISAGAVKAIHTVTLEDPLILVINLRYCRASEGVVIHRPKPSASQRGFVSRLQKAIEGLLEEGEQDDVSSIVLTDTVGQRIRLNVDNTQGTGGQRHVIIYCPYWIINTSQYSFRLREEGDVELPAGTVTPQRQVYFIICITKLTFCITSEMALGLFLQVVQFFRISRQPLRYLILVDYSMPIVVVMGRLVPHSRQLGKLAD